MAAKLEQTIAPSFTRMLNMLPADKKQGLTKPYLLKLERDIIRALEFDVQNVSAAVYIERYTNVLGLTNPQIMPMCETLLRFAYRKSDCLNMKTSVLAATCLTVAINILSSPVAEAVGASQIAAEKANWSQAIKHLRLNAKQLKVCYTGFVYTFDETVFAGQLSAEHKDSLIANF